MQTSHSLSRIEWITNIWTQRFSSTLSIIGSSAIIMMLVFQKGRSRLDQMQNRLILGMSIMDVLNSLALSVSTAASPKKLSSYIYGALGNQTTCSIQAFFITLGLSVPCYTCMLCLYYLGVIKYNMTDEALEQYERLMHITSISIPLFVSIFALSFDLFHPRTSRGCWLGDRCTFVDVKEEEECQATPESLLQTVRIILLTYLVIIFVVIVYSMGSIYFFVRKRTLAMTKYESFGRGNSVTGNKESKGVQEETYIQAMMYIMAYLCTFIAPFLNFWLGDGFAAQLFSRLFYPLQGFWNFITFIRPRYVLIREKHGHESRVWILKAVIFGMDPKTEKASLERAKQIKKEKRAESMNVKNISRLDMLRRSRPDMSNDPVKQPNDRLGSSNDEIECGRTIVGEEHKKLSSTPISNTTGQVSPSDDTTTVHRTVSRLHDESQPTTSSSHDIESQQEEQLQLVPITTFSSLIAGDVLASAGSASRMAPRRQTIVLLSSDSTTFSTSSQHGGGGRRATRRSSLPTILSSPTITPTWMNMTSSNNDEDGRQIEVMMDDDEEENVTGICKTFNIK